MSQANQMVCWGNLTRDPELKFFENGGAVCNTGVAINKTWTDPQGRKKESIEFFDLSIWGKMGENAAESLQRGDRVLVVGSLKIRRVEGDDGTKRQFAEINVEEIGPTMRWAVTSQAKNPKGDDFNQPSQAGPLGPEPDF
jgi:single-strand DNA-binding protein|tara:strand:+ start:367 stop:786 length:420 start_codon:yes stop_codon:yes gene_type:complete